jgi:hypothetical protein
VQFGLSAAAHVVPWSTSGLVRHGTAGSPFDFSGPRGLNVGRMFGGGVIKAGQEFGGDVCPLVQGQRQGFTQQVLRS